MNDSTRIMLIQLLGYIAVAVVLIWIVFFVLRLANGDEPKNRK